MSSCLIDNDHQQAQLLAAIGSLAVAQQGRAVGLMQTDICANGDMYLRVNVGQKLQVGAVLPVVLHAVCTLPEIHVWFAGEGGQAKLLQVAVCQGHGQPALSISVHFGTIAIKQSQ